ncbi:hypothetical protein [Sphingomonas sp. PB4P5]|uniref:hypothetical protein n=1 Tax=Parasphingomonas puruogangriensis TaxID=3096155 RepID=UPI002FC5F33D
MADQNDKPTDGVFENAGAKDVNDTPPADTSFRPESEANDVDAASAADAPTEQPAANAPSGTAQTLKDGAAKVAQTVGDRAKTYVEDGKSRANSALDELAQMINDAAGTVDDKIGAQYGQYARTAADTVSGFSDSLKAKNVDDLIADATAFAKKSPAIAIGTAAALGFVLIRLVQSGLNADNDQA